MTIDLATVSGKKVAAVMGRVSLEFGSDVPVFKLSMVVFEDGTELWVEGEHDMPYLPTDKWFTPELLLKHKDRES